MGNGEEERRVATARGGASKRRDGRTAVGGQSRRTHREDGRLGCGPGRMGRVLRGQYASEAPCPIVKNRHHASQTARAGMASRSIRG